MGTWTVRRLAVAALVAVIVIAGCGDDDGDDSSDATSTTEAAETTTTAVSEDGSSTTEEGDDGSTETTAEDGDSTETTVPDTSGEGQEGVGAPDEEAADVDWYADATQYRGQDGLLVAYLCPPDGDVAGEVYGTGTYADDSKVCTAAVHAGVINPVEGGRVVIEIAPGADSYTGSEANGVTSLDYGPWDGSFTFPVG